jgi:hypothetical protein
VTCIKRIPADEIISLPITCSDNELETLGWGLADSSISEAELLEWIISHC